MTSEPLGVRFETRGKIGLISLDRPKALNALTYGMILAIGPRLRSWADDPDIAAVVVRGMGDRAFCAGGDVLEIYRDGLAAREGGGSGLTRDYFREEYRLNHQIHTFPKPYVALADGIVMGGGVGLSIHGSHRVVTEATTFAMPEVGIGLFPDVGATWFLPRCPGELGTYLALTGDRCGPGDCVYIGFAQHFVRRARLDDLIDALAEAAWTTRPAGVLVEEVLDGFAEPPGDNHLAVHRDLIDHCFSTDSIDGVLDRLEAAGTDWSRQTAATIRTRSPSSLTIALRALRDGRTLDYPACVAMEYRLTQWCMAGHDWYEGIRALLVDKDKTPRWRPSSLGEVTDADVGRAFASLGENDLLVA